MDSELVRGFLRGELDAETRQRWQAHLLGCPACREAVAREEALSRLLSLAEEPPAPDGAVDRLLVRVALAHRRPALQRLVGLLPACLLAALLGAAAGLTYRLVTTSSAPERLATALGITTDRQQEVVARLDALQALSQDPWLAEDYEAVRWFDHLLTAETGG